jgi:hypothetical protein
MRQSCLVAVIVAAGELSAQSPATRPTFDRFEVATIKPTAPDYKGGRWIRMPSTISFVVRITR